MAKPNALEEREGVMNLNMIFRALIGGLLLSLVSCSSGKVIPTKDTCVVKKHWKDNVFQVIINESPINDRWYIHSEAMDITKQLGAQNRCMI